jgi:hypothetical protein
MRSNYEPLRFLSLTVTCHDIPFILACCTSLCLAPFRRKSSFTTRTYWPHAHVSCRSIWTLLSPSRCWSFLVLSIYIPSFSSPSRSSSIGEFLCVVCAASKSHIRGLPLSRMKVNSLLCLCFSYVFFPSITVLLPGRSFPEFRDADDDQFLQCVIYYVRYGSHCIDYLLSCSRHPRLWLWMKR